MTGNYIILVADDDENIRELVRLYLEKEGYTVITVPDGEKAVMEVERRSPDLVLLDIMMPVMDGWEVCRQIQSRKRFPVIMLTAKSEDYDKILGLELGADDYITKPFNPREMIARVKAVLRRTREEPAKTRIIQHRDLVINLDEYTVTHSGKKKTLTRKEFELLSMLAGSPNQVFSRESLLEQVWGYDYTGDTRTVDTHIKRLRHKLGPSSSWEIKTIWSVGYKFEVHRG